MERMRASTRRAEQAAVDIGEHLSSTRRLMRLTQQQVAERADISRSTLRRLEHGDPAVGLAHVLAVAQALGAMDRVVTAFDPLETDLGRARAHLTLPKRVRHG